MKNSSAVVVIIIGVGAAILISSVLKLTAVIKHQQNEILTLKNKQIKAQNQIMEMDEAKKNLEAKFNGMMSHLKQITETKQLLESQVDEAANMIKRYEEERKSLDSEALIKGDQINFSRSSQKESGTAGLNGEFKYLKKSLFKQTKVTPVVELRDIDAGGEIVNLPVALKESKYKIEKLPLGNYEISVTVDTDVNNPPAYPGDLKGVVPTSILKKGKTFKQEVALQYLIHLTKPVDNNGILSGNVDKYSAPISFAWEAVPQATHYVYQVSRLQKGQKRNPPFLTKQTKETNVDLTLDPNQPNEVYIFKVEAFRDKDLAGVLEIRGKNFLVEDYFFSVE